MIRTKIPSWPGNEHILVGRYCSRARDAIISIVESIVLYPEPGVVGIRVTSVVSTRPESDVEQWCLVLGSL
jgi:hypothetical protein